MQAPSSHRGRTVNRQRRALVAAVPLLASGLASAGVFSPQRARQPLLQESRPLMGTRVDISASGRDPGQLRAAIALAWAEMERLVAMMSRFRPTSVVSAINLAAGLQAIAVPPELMQVLKMARRESERSGGAFDVTVASITDWSFDPRHPRMPSPQALARQLPLVDYRHLVLDERAGTAFLTRRGMRIDLGGVAKLPILDAGIQTLKGQGITAAMINGGGDVVVGGPLEDRPWRVGVRDPRAPQRLLGVLPVSEGFVVSSGDYERYFVDQGERLHHVLDPSTGLPAHGLRGLTLVGRELGSVNGAGAALMVGGAGAARARLNAQRELEALWVQADGGLWVAPGLARRLSAA
ncbi:FAD:protein FMN transferase [Eleftheria terrae]|uniref:FAD:protein FMN transferase n=1 Tax=Eleftheria terrae TaxID=1597781 RepID=UPI00263B3238|nr:FAD:protein FMN transferase [Eleftheria terrae]WKB55416.1 FAD:protein FMN transferase [Eleftheria terrae]